MDLSQVKIIIDFETTGLNPKKDKIIQFAALKSHKGELVDEINLMINPSGRKISVGAFKAHRIDGRTLLNKPTFLEVKPQIEKFFGDATILIAHNAKFEANFLSSHGFPKSRFTFIDTLAIARRKLTKDQVLNHQMPTICRHYGIKTDFHNALHDCVALFELSTIWGLL